MDIRITVDLGSRCLEDARLNPLGEPQAIDGPKQGGLHRLDGVVLVVGGRCGTRKVVDPVDLELEGINHIVPDEFESGIANEMVNVRLATGEKIIQTDDIVSLFDKSVAEMGAEKPGSSGNQDTHKNGKG
jgi:hypothetical protein